MAGNARRRAQALLLTTALTACCPLAALAQSGPMVLRPPGQEAAPAKPAAPAPKKPAPKTSAPAKPTPAAPAEDADPESDEVAPAPQPAPAAAPRATARPTPKPQAPAKPAVKAGEARPAPAPATPPSDGKSAAPEPNSAAPAAPAAKAADKPAPAARPTPAAKTEPAPKKPEPAKPAAKTAKPGPGKKGGPLIPPLEPEPQTLSDNVIGRQPFGFLAQATVEDPTLVTSGEWLPARRMSLSPGLRIGEPSHVVTEVAQPLPRPLYSLLGLYPPSVPIHEPGMLAIDMSEAAPLALNALDAFESGLPAGPYRAGLIEEQSNNPERPRIDVGTVTWRVVRDGASEQSGSVTALRADVIVTKAKLRGQFVIRPNRDPVISAPIVIEMSFEGLDDPVVQAGVPELRSLGIDRGIPLYGTVEPRGGTFLVILAGGQNEGEQNVRLLNGRSWIDVPVRLRSGKRLMVAFEKGTAVREMLRGTLREWRSPWLP